VSDAPAHRPVPVPDETSAPFWAAAADGVLVLARCARCGKTSHPPGPVCPQCHHTDPAFTFEPVDGRGVVRSWTVLRQPFLPGFADDLPIVLVDVAIDATDDVRLIGRLLDGPDAKLRLGAPVEVAFEELGDGVAVPAFALAPS
jgi:uncharacterized OB-fold protein